MIDLKELQHLAGTLSVLYVEDDASIATLMQEYLKKFFKKVLYVEDGAKGVQAYQEEKFDIVITDLSMPVMNGLEMIKEMKQRNSLQAILITTAHSEAEYMFGAIKAGIDGYIIKPFDFTQLNAELYKIVVRLSKFKENEEYQQHLQRLVEQKTSELRYIMQTQSKNYEQTLLSMVEMIEDRDTYTAGHSKRVANYCVQIAKEMGYAQEEVTLLYQAGILHDVGKIATPDAVLLNPKTLSKIEYKLIQEHVAVGYKLLKNIPMFQSLSQIVYAHHEHYDGSGYPRGIKEEEIHPLARIMSVADSFDAMTTNRIYKGRKSVQEALQEIETLSGTQFDPDVVKSAQIALRDVVIDTQINQLPRTEIEEERFAYFYKDSLNHHLYNANYFELLLVRNDFSHEYSHLTILFLKHFSEYNRNKSWSDGNELLTQVATLLDGSFEDVLLFRIFGDDFAILSQEELKTKKFEEKLQEILKYSSIRYEMKRVDLREVHIENIKQIEEL